VIESNPRGIRLNNPCNIRISSSAWRGKITPSEDPNFEQFDTAHNGIRAAVVLFRHYTLFYGLNTVDGLINRWAPSVENNTTAYVLDVANRMVVRSTDCLNMSDAATLKSFIEAVIWHEEGIQPYGDDVILAAVQDALEG